MATPPTQPTPAGQPVADNNAVMNAAKALVALHKQLLKEKRAVNAAAQEVSKHKQGGDNPRAWDNLARHHGRFQAALCFAVGLDARVPDFHEETHKALEEATAAGIGPLAGNLKVDEKDPLKQGLRGEYSKGSFKETMSWIFLNLGGRTKVEGRRSWVPVDPDFEGSNDMIAAKLDETARQVLEALKKEHEKETKAGNKGTPEYQARGDLISDLEMITGFQKATEYQKAGTQYSAGKYTEKGRFRKLVRDVDDEIEVLDKDWARRRRRDFGVGAWGLNRHDERNPDDMFLFGALAAKLGVHVNSFKVIFGFDHPRFQVISQVHYDEKTGKPTYTGHVTGIPLFNSKGLQRCAGMLVAMAYANDYKGTPMLEKEPIMEPVPLMKENAEGKLEPVLDEAGNPVYEKDENGQVKMREKRDEKGDIEYEPEMVKDKDGKEVPKKDAEGNIIYKNKLDQHNNVILKRDDKGNVMYNPLSPTQRDSIMKKPFPSFSLPSGYPDHALDFLFDMIAQHEKMGGAPPICGFNPNAKSPEGMFDANQLEEACKQMDSITKKQFMQKLYQGAKDAYYPAAIKKWEKNIRNPKVYAAAQQNEVYALERILRKNPELDPRPPVNPKDPTQKRPLDHDDVAHFKAGVVGGQQGDPSQAEDRANRLQKMQKRALNNEEKKEVLDRHMAIPDVPPGQGQRTRIEQEMTRISYMDTSGNVKPSLGRETEVSNTKTPAEQRELKVADEKRKTDSALSVVAQNEQAKLDDLLAKQKAAPNDSSLSIEIEKQKELVDNLDSQQAVREAGIMSEVEAELQMVVDHLDLDQDASVPEIRNILMKMHGKERIQKMALELKQAKAAGNPRCVKLENGEYKVVPIDKSSPKNKQIEKKLQNTESFVQKRSASRATVSADGKTVESLPSDKKIADGKTVTRPK